MASRRTTQLDWRSGHRLAVAYTPHRDASYCVNLRRRPVDATARSIATLTQSQVLRNFSATISGLPSCSWIHHAVLANAMRGSYRYHDSDNRILITIARIYPHLSLQLSLNLPLKNIIDHQKVSLFLRVLSEF
jgi:hypothetical protein